MDEPLVMRRGVVLRAVDLDPIKRAIVASRPMWANLALLAGGLVLATGVRLAIDRGENGVPFLTFYPLVLLSAIFLGARYAVLCALLAALVTNRVFMAEPWLTQNLAARLALLLLYGVTIFVIVGTGHVMRRLVVENEDHSRQQESFNAELQHRTKNALQIIRALIARGPRGEDPASYFKALAGRLDALASANELLRFGILESAPLRQMVDTAVRPFDRDRFALEGPDCEVARSSATSLMMGLHELCTNATKYGALSGEDGMVAVTWSTTQGDKGPEILIDWSETGGPDVEPPQRRGLGSRLLAPNAGLVRVDMDWRKEGLRCRMAVRQAGIAD